MCDDVCEAYVTRISAWFVALSGHCVPTGMEKQDIEALVSFSPRSLHPRGCVLYAHQSKVFLQVESSPTSFSFFAPLCHGYIFTAGEKNTRQAH